jgi:replicative DNA helicase
MMEDFQSLAVHQSEHYKAAYKLIESRKKGLVTSLKTPWDKFNNETLDGIEWKSMITIAARSSVGKTAAKDNIIRNAYMLNNNTDFEVVEFQFELPGAQHAIRQLAGHMNMSYQAMQSKGEILSDENLNKIKSSISNLIKYPMPYVINKPISVSQIRAEIEFHSGRKFAGKKVIYTLDHALLVYREGKQDERQMLNELGSMITEMKNKYDLIFILLSQLNRNIENPLRSEDGKPGNYINSGDLFGSDAIMQHSDVVVGLNRPGMFNIRYYGPSRHIIDSRYLSVFHMIKNRNGESGQMLWFNFDGKTMSFVERDEPKTKPNLDF